MKEYPPLVVTVADHRFTNNEHLGCPVIHFGNGDILIGQIQDPANHLLGVVFSAADNKMEIGSTTEPMAARDLDMFLVVSSSKAASFRVLANQFAAAADALEKIERGAEV